MTEHATPAMKRTTTPRAIDIARHWIRHQPDGSQMVVDLGEPSCMACGWYLPGTLPEDLAGIEQRWEHRYSQLEKCHLIPHALGGGSTVENMVLLCTKCHEDAPDFADPTYMLDWIGRREPDGEMERYMKVFNNPQVRPLVMKYLEVSGGSAGEFLDHYAEALEGLAVTHFGKYVTETRIATASHALLAVIGSLPEGTRRRTQ